MSKTAQKLPKFHFLKTFVLPALLVFLVPVFSFFFFLHAQGRYDDQIREAILKQIRIDRRISEEERARAIAFFTEVPFSQVLANEEIAAALPSDTRFHYATFRWMILLSAASVLAGVAVFLLAGVCVALSLHSQFVQYLSLSAGWHVLRIFGALQTAAQGVLLVALSYWVTALWFHVYSVKLILVAALLAVVGVAVVIAAIFKRVKDDFAVAGQVLAKEEAAPIWDELCRICARVGTQPPDQIIAGIDDNFFVTEHPVTVGDRTYRGRTLFVSLSLLKQLQGSEADAVLAHEMAHFSGQDTLYSRKITPLLSRYGHYLHALHEGGVTRPIYYFMLCFRALYQLSLGRLSRQREFRADRIAVETTSPRDVAGALLRTVAYSRYRNEVEQDLFKQERALETANVCERIEQGFRRYEACFVSGPDIGQLAPAHPFDSHPPLAQRLQAIGVPLESGDTQTLLATPGDGKWYQYVPTAEQMETEQWRQYEERFRAFHEQSLPYRFLPESAEECEIVVKAFPPIGFSGSQGVLTLDYEKMGFDKWPEPVRYAEITNLALDDNSVLKVTYQRQGKQVQSIKMSKFADQQHVLDAIKYYYGRYLAAAEYQKQKRQETGAANAADREVPPAT
jgi:Zn-dependent protease with chaperone function